MNSKLGDLQASGVKKIAVTIWTPSVRVAAEQYIKNNCNPILFPDTDVKIFVSEKDSVQNGRNLFGYTVMRYHF